MRTAPRRTPQPSSWRETAWVRRSVRYIRLVTDREIRWAGDRTRQRRGSTASDPARTVHELFRRLVECRRALVASA